MTPSQGDTMDLRALTVLLATLFGAARIWSFHRRGIGSVRALGLSVDVQAPALAAVGIAISLVAIAVVFVVAYATRSIQVQSVGSPLALLNDLGSHVGVSLVEELVFRSALLGGLLVLLPKFPWVAVGCSATVFGALHALNQHATPLAVLGSTLGGFYYGAAFAVTERIWLSAGLHFGWNCSIGSVFGFPLSGSATRHATLVQQRSVGAPWWTGGDYGPEGGVVGLVGRMLVVAFVLVWLAHWRRRRGLSEGPPHGWLRPTPTP
jgi:membrane protease YdiL (CAAX protease family)